MTVSESRHLVTTSERLYRAFLVLYPHRFRHEYGYEMLQTFRDCCREARREQGMWGMTRLWGVVLCDLVVSVSSEHSKAWAARLRRLVGLEEEYAMMSHLLNFDVALRSDIGCKRANNEDNMVSVVPQDAQMLQEKGALFVVADGMGGHERGEVASKITVDEVKNHYYQSNEDIASALVQAIKHANERVYQGAVKPGEMGSTCIAAVVHGDSAYIANVGDSRAYIVRGGEVRQISRDHSWVEEQVREGKLTEEEARTHEKRNVITRCLGTQGDVEVDLFTEAVQTGDILVLCTDGLSSLIDNKELCEIVENYSSEESVERLIARANERGGPDNITAIVAKIS